MAMLNNKMVYGLNIVSPTKTFLHIHMTHPDSIIIYLSQEDERKHCKQNILTWGFGILGFGVLTIFGFRVSVF